MKKIKRNAEIHNLIAKSGLRYWEVAERLNINPSRLSVLLRHPLDPTLEAELRKVLEAERSVDDAAII